MHSYATSPQSCIFSLDLSFLPHTFMPNPWIHIFIYVDYSTSNSTQIFAPKPHLSFLFQILVKSIFIDAKNLSWILALVVICFFLILNPVQSFTPGGGEEVQRALTFCSSGLLSWNGLLRSLTLAIELFLGSDLEFLPPLLKFQSMTS